jgi:hypothetical protein
MLVSAEQREADAHNRWRYGELMKLRNGQANCYSETRYR